MEIKIDLDKANIEELKMLANMIDLKLEEKGYKDPAVDHEKRISEERQKDARWVLAAMDVLQRKHGKFVSIKDLEELAGTKRNIHCVIEDLKYSGEVVESKEGCLERI